MQKCKFCKYTFCIESIKLELFECLSEATILITFQDFDQILTMKERLFSPEYVSWKCTSFLYIEKLSVIISNECYSTRIFSIIALILKNIMRR